MENHETKDHTRQPTPESTLCTWLSRNKKLVAVIVVLVAIFGGFGNKNEKHAVLTVTFGDSPETDHAQIENTLKIGGFLKCGADSDYVKVLKDIDSKFENYGAIDSKGAYYILPAVLNWISSKGWKFQQKFCINMNDNNAQYYFVK